MSRSRIDQAVWLSRPDVGSSRKTRSCGRAANSTPMVRRLRCSTLRPQTEISYSTSHCNIELTFSRDSHNGFGILLHSQQADDLLNVVQLLLLAVCGGLTHQSTELQGFPDCISGQVYVKLLCVSRLALKRGVTRRPVDKDMTRYNTNCRTCSKDIKECCFACTRWSLSQMLA